MADTLFLRKGLLADLKNAPILNGSINITTDEPGIYVDFDGKRSRVGDVITVTNLSDIVVDHENWTGVVTSAEGMVSTWSNTALYYVTNGNHLLKFVPPADPTASILTGSWVKINNTADIEDDLADLTEQFTEFKTFVSNTYETKDAATGKWNAQAVKDKAQDDALTAENERAVAAEQALGNRITDVNDDLTAHKTLAAQTYETKTDATEKFNTNKASIEAEVSRAKAAEEKLTSDLAAEVSRATAKENQIAQDLADHTSFANTTYATKAQLQEADERLTKAIGDEVTRATRVEGELNTAITTEKSRAEGQEAAIRQELADHAALAQSTYETKANVKTIKEALEQADATEKARAEAAEKKLTEDLAEEAKTARAAEKKLTDDLADHVAFAEATYDTKANVKSIKEALEAADKAENERAVAAEKKLTDDLAAEVSRAKGVEAGLSSTITDNYNSLTTRINNEVKAINDTIGTKDDVSGTDTVYGNLKAYTDSKMVAADAMKFMGVVSSANQLGVIGNTASNPVEAGWTYKVGAEFDITPVGETSAITVHVGDLLIAAADQGSGAPANYNGGWYHISSGYEDDVDPVLSNNKTNKTITLRSHAGEDRGTVKFSTNENSNVQITMTGDPDAQTGKTALTNITVEMVWGSFN